MTKPTLISYLREHLEAERPKKDPGPYLTISRQYGCDGYELGLVLVELLNERDPQQRWRLWYKELLSQLAEDTGVDVERLGRERLAKPGLIKDFLRGLKKSDVPDRVEILNHLRLMIRTLAFNGYCIIIGRGGAAASSDVANGLSLRIEAPKEWRIARLCQRESISRQAAADKLERIEKERAHLRAYYTQQNPREPAFNLVFDNSVFPKASLAALVIKAMEEKKMIEKLAEK
jgi:hypothetical protein